MMKTHANPIRRQGLSELTHRLRGQACKVTGPRQAILEILHHHAHPITSKDILAALPKGQCDLATIYRTMHLLEEKGIVKRLDFSDGAARFELVDEAGGHHHHLVCTRCAAAIRIAECFAREMDARVAAEHGFTGVTHKLEFFGLCPRCQPGSSQP
jgi:Fur family transcriptional regulator, ferric uptake regulator